MKIDDVTARLKDIPELKSKVSRLELAHHFSSTPEERQEIEQVLLALYHMHYDLTDNGPHFAATDEKTCDGDFYLGKMVAPGGKRHSFSFRKSELRQHLSIFGRAGAGKTNMVYQLLTELHRQGLPFLLTDWKNDYADLDWKHLLKSDVHVLPVGQERPGLQLNPLIPPPGVEPGVWLKRISEVFTHAYMGGPRFEQILRDACHELYKKHGVYDGTVTSYPTVHHIKELLDRRHTTGREAQWMQSVNSALSSLCFGGTGKTLDAPIQPQLDFLLKENVVLDLSALNNADKTFLVETLLLWIYYYRLAQDATDKIESVILLEEAHHLLREHQEADETIIDVTLREIRSLGIGIVIIDQMPHLISKVALANTYATACLNLKLSEDKEKIARCMGLNKEQKDALGNLPIGAAVFKMQDRFTKPFVLKIPHVKVRRRSRKRVPASPYAAQPSSKRTAANQPANGLPPRVPAVPPTEKLETRLLLDVITHPTSTVVERYERLGVSRRKGNMAKQWLTREELIDEEIIRGRNGAWVKLLKPTPNGYAHLTKNDVAFEKVNGRGGVEHKYWIRHIKEHLENTLDDAYTVRKEHPIGEGKTIDLAILKDDLVITAIEVETGKSSPTSNVQKCRAKGIPQILVACTRKKTVEHLELPGDVKCVLAQDVLRLEPGGFLTRGGRSAR